MSLPEQLVVFALLGLGGEVVWTARGFGWGRAHSGFGILYALAPILLPVLWPSLAPLPEPARLALLVPFFVVGYVGTEMAEGSFDPKRLLITLPGWFLLARLTEQLWLATAARL